MKVHGFDSTEKTVTFQFDKMPVVTIGQEFSEDGGVFAAQITRLLVRIGALLGKTADAMHTTKALLNLGENHLLMQRCREIDAFLEECIGATRKEAE